MRGDAEKGAAAGNAKISKCEKPIHIGTIASSRNFSLVGKAAIKFEEHPRPSVPTRNRIGMLDKLSRHVSSVIQGVVPEANSKCPDIPSNMLPGTQANDMARRCSLSYEIEDKEAEQRRWSQRIQVMMLVAAALAFVVTFGVQVYTLMKVN